MDTLTSLMFGVTLRKAAALQEWLVAHRMCYPGARVAIADDNIETHGACSCGEAIDLTVAVSVIPRISKKGLL